MDDRRGPRSDGGGLAAGDGSPGGRPWPTDVAWGDAAPRPGDSGKAQLVLFFNLECASCVSRAVPLLKRIGREHGDGLILLAVHTSFGHRYYPRDQVAPQLERFARDFARLEVPVALDLDGETARAWGAQGTPHWLVFNRLGRLERSIYGSQENAQTRLRYLLEELTSDD